jgi:hypothetical protein
MTQLIHTMDLFRPQAISFAFPSSTKNKIFSDEILSNSLSDAQTPSFTGAHTSSTPSTKSQFRPSFSGAPLRQLDSSSNLPSPSTAQRTYYSSPSAVSRDTLDKIDVVVYLLFDKNGLAWECQWLSEMEISIYCFDLKNIFRSLLLLPLSECLTNLLSWYM